MAAVRTLSATWATTRGYTARLCSSTSSNASLCFITRKLALWSRAVASMELKHSTGSVPSPWLCGHRANFSTSATARAGSPFHFAFPVRNVEESRAFYGELLGCHEGRSKPGKWIDFSLGGNQIVCHWVGDDYKAPEFFNPMDGDEVPVPHFGLVVAEDEFNRLAKRLEAAGVHFLIRPTLRFKGAPGEQWTMFFKDPSNNALEFKAMRHPENLFAKYEV